MTARGYVLCVTLNPVLDTTCFVDEMRPVYRTEAHRVTHVAGGKGANAARALGLLGVPAHSLVAVGGMIGRNLVEVWQADPYDATPVWVSGDTRLQVTVIDRRGAQRAFYAPPAPFTSADAAAAERAFAGLLGGAAAVCVCGSSPGPAADALYAQLIRSARQQRVLTLLDTYGEALRHGLAARPDVVKVNLAEAEGLLKRRIAGESAEQQAVADLRAAGSRLAILTLGERGALLAAEAGIWHAAPPRLEALNPIGSGDAMTAGLVAGLLAGSDPVEAFRNGMAAAAANTLTWEACRFEPADVQRLAPGVTIERVNR